MEENKQILEIGQEGLDWCETSGLIDFQVIQMKKKEITAKYKTIRDEINKKAGIIIDKNADDDDVIWDSL